MRIVNLIENTEGVSGCIPLHGLSFYVETKVHKLLLDLGPSEDTIKNAEMLGVDLKAVDTMILSHGHYDHSGGILPFVKINPKAVIYMQKKALDDYYSDDGEGPERERYRYIGIDKEIAKLSQVVFVEGNLKIDDELELFKIQNRSHALPFTNKQLLIRKGNDYIRDDFTHEHYLMIHENEKHILMSGCAHNGILSILDTCRETFGYDPDVVISGFHLKKKSEYKDEELEEVLEIAKELKKYPTKFITCHCTGIPAYEAMKEILGDQLDYVHTGEEIRNI